VSKAKQRFKGNRITGGFLALPYTLLQSPSFVSLSPNALKLLIDLAAQYRGDNNGDLSLAWKLMQPRGWRSQTTLHNSKNELLEKAFIFETRKGQRPNKCSLFALTWFDLDPNDKYDAWTAKAFTRNAFKLNDIAPAIKKKQNTPLTPLAGVAAP